MTLAQQIFLAIIGIICLAIVTAIVTVVIVLGVIAYTELFLRDAESEDNWEETEEE